MCIFSIQLNSNRPEQTVILFDNIEAMSDNPQDIEVLLHIDTGDTIMEALVASEQKKRKFILKVFSSDLVKGYATLWKPLNLLWKETDPQAYFILNISDEMLFQTQGWDTIVKQYIGYYPDHVFRLRASKYRYRNYTDFWENGYAPDSLAFYTRKWLELSGDWNPCLGPDSFQQCVAFYLFTSEPFSHTQYNRDIPVPDLHFSGEGAGIGLEGYAKYKRILINNRAWFILMSRAMQQEAKRRAMRIKSYILAQTTPDGEILQYTECAPRNLFFVTEQRTGKIVATLSYRLSWLRITLTNLWRARCVHYYAGGGVKAAHLPLAGYFVMLVTYIPYGAELFTKAAEWRDARGRWRGEWNNQQHKLRNKYSTLKDKWNTLRRGIYTPLDLQHSRMMPVRQLLLSIIRSCTNALSSMKGIVPSAFKPILSAFIRTLKVCTRPIRKIVKPIAVAKFILNGILKTIDTFIELLRYYILRPLVHIVLSFVRTLKQLWAIIPFVHKRVMNKQEPQWELCTLPVNNVATPSDKVITFSIQLSSNRPNNVIALFDNIEKTAHKPEHVEVLIHIDTGDVAMENMLQHEITQRRFAIRYLSTDLVKGFTHLWKAYNPLFQLTDPNAYFVTLFSDEMRFETVGWDSMLLELKGYYPDHIFRVRGSKYRFRNYTDAWECGFAPDSLAFYTRQWLAIQGDWNPCTGPDSFQQCVAYYLFTSDPFSHTQFQRDIVAPFLRFSGEGGGVGLEGEAREKRIRENNQEWFSLMSHPMQENAKRRAMQIKSVLLMAEAAAADADAAHSIHEHKAGKTFALHKNGEVVRTLKYNLSRTRITLTNILRAPWVHYYAGGGKESLRLHPWNGMKMMIDTFSPRGQRLLKQLKPAKQKFDRYRGLIHHGRNHVIGTWKHHGFVKGNAVLLKQVCVRMGITNR